MTDSCRLTALYADDLQLQREQVARRATSTRLPPRRTTRRAIAAGLHRLADRFDDR